MFYKLNSERIPHVHSAGQNDSEYFLRKSQNFKIFVRRFEHNSQSLISRCTDFWYRSVWWITVANLLPDLEGFSKLSLGNNPKKFAPGKIMTMKEKSKVFTAVHFNGGGEVKPCIFLSFVSQSTLLIPCQGLKPLEKSALALSHIDIAQKSNPTPPAGVCLYAPPPVQQMHVSGSSNMYGT